MKTRTFIILIVSVIIIIFVFLYLKSIYDKFSDAHISDDLKVTAELPKQYQYLFKHTDRLSDIETVKGKWREPITEFCYDGKFLVMVYQVDTIQNRSVAKIVTETYNDTEISYGEVYNNASFSGQSFVAINYRSGKPGKASAIQLNFFGDKARVLIKNDTVAYYNPIIDNFFLQYEDSNKQDFYIKHKIEGQNPQMETMLLKKEGRLLFILLFNKHHTENIAAGTLKGILR